VRAEARPAARPEECAAVVVHYRCPEAAAGCLASLAEHAPGLRVFLVENGSGDGSAARLEPAAARHPACTLLALPENKGFGAGCNHGIDAALALAPRPAQLLLLNPDTRVCAGFLEELLATAARHPDAGVVGGRILDGGGRRTLFENGRIGWALTGCHAPAPAGRTEFRTPFITGALMLLAGDLLAAGVRFDEAYFLYVEDMDLCCEVRARGRTLWMNLAATVRHDEGGSQAEEAPFLAGLRRRQLFYLARNKVYLARKRLRLPRRLAFYLAAFLIKPLAGLALGGGIGFLKLYIGALRAGLAMPLRGR